MRKERAGQEEMLRLKYAKKLTKPLESNEPLRFTLLNAPLTISPEQIQELIIDELRE